MKYFLHLTLFFILSLAIQTVQAEDSINADDQDQMTQIIHLADQLSRVRLKKIQPILSQLEITGADIVQPMFEAMRAGNLYYLKADKNSQRRPVIVESLGDSNYQLKDAITLDKKGQATKKQLKKIRSNNKIRGFLRDAIARLTLSSENPEVREAAVKNMLASIDEKTIDLLLKARLQEQDDDILELMDVAIALHTLRTSEDAGQRLAALEPLEQSLLPVVRNSLNQLVAVDAAGKYIEADDTLRVRASEMLKDIQQQLDFYGFIETLFFGLSLGSVLLLVATGLSITFGVMGVINMAHGELIMLGAYTTYVVQLMMPNYIEYSILVAIPAAFVVSGLVGIAIERGVIRFLQGRPLETLLATFGISLVLQQAVRSMFSPLNRQVASPEWMSGSLEINAVLSITYNRLYILIFALLVFFALQLIMKKTPLGLYVRAVSQNRDMAKAIGIRSGWVDAMTFGLGSGIAGVAGVALSQLTNVGPNLGQAYIIDSFMVVVFGGVGNLWGTLVGGMSLGLVNKFLEPALGAVLANILVLVFIILFIQKRPRGLFPQKGRVADS
ncbi:MAG: urea ABC transporter permease subunit UrtB [Pseudomonadales bacterium]|nr:urea ABC transporter permease subunit UrtB [Pseudomonadales bacterium]